ncbi:MAG TPA: hypothetical protein VFH66_07885 [Mycobacteriales bacterium]|nr:hypothetical protein [Mycobacteriales bacterium]
MTVSRTQRKVALSIGGVTFVSALLAASANVAAPHVRGLAPSSAARESLANFALEHPEAALMHRHLPLAFIKEKLENGAESVSGPSQEQYENRAYPRSTIADKQRRAARAAYLRLQHTSRGGGTTGASGTTSLTASTLNSAASTAAWSYLGPETNNVPGPSTQNGVATTNSGRTTSVVVTPGCTDGSCTVYIGTAGGGVWKTTDGLSDSASWTFVSAGIPSGAIGSLFYDVANDTLYAGTGEPNGSGDSEAGVGLYKTVNGGTSWSLVGDSNVTARDRSVGAIAVASDGTVYMGTDVARHGSSSVNGGRRTPPDAAPLGLYRMRPQLGESSFTPIFSKPGSPVNPGAGTGSDWFQGGVNHIELDPKDDNTVYASLFGYGIWRSSARLDGTTAFRHVFATSNPKDTFGDRTEFALTVKNGKTRIYAGDENDDKGWSWVWRTDNADRPANQLTNANGNGGWIQLSNPGNGQEGFDSYNFCESQCGYDMFVVTPPGHPDIVYIGGSMNYDEIYGTVPPRSNGRAVMRSSNAGRDFTDMTEDAAGIGMHPDEHGLAFVPGRANQFFEVNDGGVLRVDDAAAVDQTSQCAERGLRGYDLLDCQRWLKATPQHIAELSQGLPTLQFQSISTYQSGGETHYLGGTQDNGTWAFGPGESGFESVGGDGGQSATDSGNSNVHFHTYYSSYADVNAFPAGDVYGAGLNPNHWDYVSQKQDSSGEAASFYVPFVNDPNNPGWIYEGLQHVWRTEDDGGDYAYLDANCSETDPSRFNPTATCGDFEPIGQNLTSSSFGDRAGHYVVAISTAPTDSSVMWAATRIGRVFVSTNATADAKAVTFTRIDGSTSTTHILPGRFVSGIAVDPGNPYHAFISYSGYSAYAAGGHVYDVTYDPATGTATAKDISGTPGDSQSIGDMPVTGIAYDATNDELYASTDFGVITAPSSGGDAWSAAGTGFPISTVYGLTLAGNQLIAATHGRGAWTLPLP